MAFYLDTNHGGVLIEFIKDTAPINIIAHTIAMVKSNYLSHLHFFIQPTLPFKYNPAQFLLFADPTYTAQCGPSMFYLETLASSVQTPLTTKTTFVPIFDEFTNEQKQLNLYNHYNNDEPIFETMEEAHKYTIKQILEKATTKTVLLLAIPNENNEIGSTLALFFPHPPKPAQNHSTSHKQNEQVKPSSEQYTPLPEHLYNYVIGKVVYLDHDVGNDHNNNNTTHINTPTTNTAVTTNLDHTTLIKLLTHAVPDPITTTLAGSFHIDTSNDMNFGNTTTGNTTRPTPCFIRNCAMIAYPQCFPTASPTDDTPSSSHQPQHTKHLYLMTLIHSFPPQSIKRIFPPHFHQQYQTEVSQPRDSSVINHEISTMNDDIDTNDNHRTIIVFNSIETNFHNSYYSCLRQQCQVNQSKMSQSINNNTSQSLNASNSTFSLYAKHNDGENADNLDDDDDDDDSNDDGDSALMDNFTYNPHPQHDIPTMNSLNPQPTRYNNNITNQYGTSQISIRIGMETPSNIIFVSNLNASTTEMQLSNHISQWANIIDLRIIHDYSKCYAFIALDTANACDNVIKNGHKSILDKHTININYSHSSDYGDSTHFIVHMQNLLNSKQQRATLASTTLAQSK